MLDLDQAIRERHSTRLFLPQPVPRELMNEALALAQCAPSNSNIQPCHMVFASEEYRNRLVAALIDEAQRWPRNIAPARVGSSGVPSPRPEVRGVAGARYFRTGRGRRTPPRAGSTSWPAFSCFCASNHSLDL